MDFAALALPRNVPLAMPHHCPDALSLITHWARLRPYQVALFSAGEALTFAGVFALVERAAIHLTAFGLGPAASFAVLAQSRTEILLLHYAALRVGSTMILIDPNLAADAAAMAYAHSGAQALFYDAALFATAREFCAPSACHPVGEIRTRPWPSALADWPTA